MSARLDRFLSLGVALAAAGLLLAAFPASPVPTSPAPTPEAVAWPRAQVGTTPGTLPDAAPYQPLAFMDAQTSIGTALTSDHRALRLVLRGPGPAVRELRRQAVAENPHLGNVAVGGDSLAWAENDGGRLELWTADLRDPRPAHEVTADTGPALLDALRDDLVIAGGRLYWASSTVDGGPVTEIRSVALAGGPVSIEPEPGNWELSGWPWLANGRTAATGTTILRNLVTHKEIAVPGTGAGPTSCGPAWCEVVTLAGAGHRVELMRPDGTDRRTIATGAVLPAITTVAPLDRFEVLSQVDPYSDLTVTQHVLVYDIATRQSVDISPAAHTVACTAGVLWWSTGAPDALIWHAVDLRTV